jgi:hypothetical protein
VYLHIIMWILCLCTVLLVVVDVALPWVLSDLSVAEVLVCIYTVCGLLVWAVLFLLS